MGGGDVVKGQTRQLFFSLQSETYGSNSAGGRDGADSAGALAEGVSEHNGGVLYVPGVGKESNCNRLAIVERGDLMLKRELLERIWTGTSKTCQLPAPAPSSTLALARDKSGSNVALRQSHLPRVGTELGQP